jgi:hypothetical protein
MQVSPPAQNGKKVQRDTKKEKGVKAVDTVYKYCYILSTIEQRKALDLIKHKTKLVKTITEFFGERLIEIIVQKDRYMLTLNESYMVSDKRRLGRLISERVGLSSYSHKVQYNNNQDISGQLFRICKEKELT